MARGLPQDAYTALEALKEQASAIQANKFKGDEKALKLAQKKMVENIFWVKEIAGFLRTNTFGITIDNISNEVIEKYM